MIGLAGGNTVLKFRQVDACVRRNVLMRSHPEAQVEAPLSPRPKQLATFLYFALLQCTCTPQAESPLVSQNDGSLTYTGHTRTCQRVSRCHLVSPISSACPSYMRLLRRWLFCSPYVRTCALLVPQRLPLPGRAWTSETDETIGDTLSFGLAGYFTVTEMQLRFPVGDTYKFDLALFNGLDGTGEAYVTISVRVSHAFFLFFVRLETFGDVTVRLPSNLSTQA